MDGNSVARQPHLSRSKEQQVEVEYIFLDVSLLSLYTRSVLTCSACFMTGWAVACFFEAATGQLNLHWFRTWLVFLRCLSAFGFRPQSETAVVCTAPTRFKPSAGSVDSANVRNQGGATVSRTPEKSVGSTSSLTSEFKVRLICFPFQHVWITSQKSILQIPLNVPSVQD